MMSSRKHRGRRSCVSHYLHPGLLIDLELLVLNGGAELVV
jgi:hypothetical protein